MWAALEGRIKNIIRTFDRAGKMDINNMFSMM